MKILLLSLIFLGAIYTGTAIADTSDTELRLFQWRDHRVNAGYEIAFSGNLKNDSGEPIPNAEIIIKIDSQCILDGIIASGITDSKGRYFITTEAVIWDKDGMVKAHAEFPGDSDNSPSVSRQQIIVIYPSAHGRICQ